RSFGFLNHICITFQQHLNNLYLTIMEKHLQGKNITKNYHIIRTNKLTNKTMTQKQHQLRTQDTTTLSLPKSEHLGKKQDLRKKQSPMAMYTQEAMPMTLSDHQREAGVTQTTNHKSSIDMRLKNSEKLQYPPNGNNRKWILKDTTVNTKQTTTITQNGSKDMNLNSTYTINSENKCNKLEFKKYSKPFNEIMNKYVVLDDASVSRIIPFQPIAVRSLRAKPMMLLLGVYLEHGDMLLSVNIQQLRSSFYRHQYWSHNMYEREDTTSFRRPFSFAKHNISNYNSKKSDRVKGKGKAGTIELVQQPNNEEKENKGPCKDTDTSLVSDHNPLKPSIMIDLG
ncbi:unnamed protein product, partial [Meganyctiphanes norvegica]